MISSLRLLLNSPYNRRHPFNAFKRFISWKFIRLLKLKNQQLVFWGNRKISIQYNSFSAMWLMYNCWLDWNEFNLIKNYLLDGDIVVDAGANIGIYSLWMSRFTGVRGKVYAFEPDGNNYFSLNNNINLNSLALYIIPVQKAVGNINGIISFTSGLDGENHINKNDMNNTVNVKCVKLDDFFVEYGIDHVSYMKVDVEGFELDVLRGCVNYITAKKIEIIQLEINQTMRNSGYNTDQLTDFLNTHGYQLCCYDVFAKQLKLVIYNSQIENYFAVFDLAKANKKLVVKKSNQT